MTGPARLKGWLARHWQGSPYSRPALALAVTCALAALLVSGLQSDRIRLEAGDVAPYDIEAPKDFIDRPATEALREEAARRTPEVYRADPQVAERVQERAEADFETIRRLQADKDLLESDRVTRLAEALRLDLRTDAYRTVLALDERSLRRLETDLLGLLATQAQRNIPPGELETFRRQAATAARGLGYPPPLSDFLAEMARSRVEPNFFVDEEATAEARAQARAEVQPVRIVRGQLLVSRGQRMAADDLVRLQDAGLLEQRNPAWIYAASLFLAAAFVLLMGLFLRFMRPELYERRDYLVLIALIGWLTVLLARVLAPVSGYLAPLATATMLLAILFDPVLALLAGAELSLLAGLIAGQSLSVAVVAFVAGCVGVFGVQRVSQRSDIMRASLLVALVNVIVITSFGLIQGALPPAPWPLARDALFGLANAVILGGFITIGALPTIENAFGILTSTKLLELSNPNQPLLRRLLLEAPGSYHHSLMVANLAEQAAEALGANALLARVGAYYHDVGKLRRPYFFIENQFGGENPHDRLSPRLSQLIITAHVREGAEMARQAGLPQRVIDFIWEHHGTTLVSYFYNRAQELAKDGETVSEADFRHEGRRPASKETAIVMLADGCEAATRALGKPLPAKIEAVVRKIVRDRLEDGQLDRCNLTLGELETIVQTFVRILTGVYHARVEYPETFVREMQQDRPQGERIAGHAGGMERGARRRERA